MAELRVWRARDADRARAFELVDEYNDAVGVVVRDTAESFAHDFFFAGSGFWLAESVLEAEPMLAGCIAMRPLPQCGSAAEIKRLYVRPAFRGTGVALALLSMLEAYAMDFGYDWLYLDSKDDLKAALRFYQRHGYEPCARYNANPQATVFLRKPLAG